METKNFRVLMWLAGGLMVIAAIIEATEGEYLKMAMTCCTALFFLLLPLTSMPTKPRHQKSATVMAILLMLIWVGLFAYKLMGKRGA